MPLYSFVCPCGNKGSEYTQMAHAVPVGEHIVCPVCGKRTYRRVPDYVHSDLKEFHAPIEMHSVAATSWEEIREIQEKCPDVQISDNPADELFGVPIAKNRKEKKQVLAAVGYVENN